MSSGEQEALRLADALEQGTYLLSVERNATAAELRRLVAEVGALREKLEDAEENVALLGAVARGHMELLAEREADRAAMREALEALEHHVQQTRPIARTSAAISLLKERIE